MILELDGQVAKGTELIIIAEVSKDEREKSIEQLQARSIRCVFMEAFLVFVDCY